MTNDEIEAHLTTIDLATKYPAGLLAILQADNPIPLLQRAMFDCWRAFTLLNILTSNDYIPEHRASGLYSAALIRGAVLHQTATHLQVTAAINAVLGRACKDMWMQLEARTPGCSRRLLEVVIVTSQSRVDLRTIPVLGNA